jgi:predicted metal-binding membrane protein
MPGFGVTAPSTLERILLVILLGLLTLAAWISLGLQGDSIHAIHHHLPGMMGAGFLHNFFLFVPGWAAMTIAMMLPTALPILRIFHNFASQRRDRALLLTLVVGGYLITWILFGILVFLIIYFAGNSVHRFLPRVMNLGTPVVVLVAGLFQFSSLKYRCLDKCRSPFSFVMQYWQGRKYQWLAFRLGIDHGLFCVGCCWALMMLMFVVGFESLTWMFVLAAIMAVEKNVSWGKKLSAPVGIALIGWSIVLISLQILHAALQTR